jgi:uncharacterized protein (AIM24 family)
MQYAIHGELAQHAVLTLERDETCWAAKGGIMSYTDGIEWALRVPGGVSGAAGRVFAGAAFFGGAGLFLQRVSGAGTVLIHGSGDLDDRTRSRPGNP